MPGGGEYVGHSIRDPAVVEESVAALIYHGEFFAADAAQRRRDTSCLYG